MYNNKKANQASILVIPDPHATPEHDNDRAHLLSALIDDLRPPTIVQMGDLFSMDSLSSFDKGRWGSVGRTYKADLAAGIDFHEKMWASFSKTKNRYKPRRVALEGNHEQRAKRAKRAVDIDHTLAGLMSFSDFQFDPYYTDVVEYVGSTPGIIEIDGVVFAHYIAGMMCKALSGVHYSHSILSKYHKSFVVAHSHFADWKTHVGLDGQRLTGVVAGCFIATEHVHSYAGQAQSGWWRGVVLLKGVEHGQFDTEWVSMTRLRETNGQSKV